MIDDAETLDSALNRPGIGAGPQGVSPMIAALVDVAVELTDSFGTFRLTAADHDRLYAESMIRLETALRENQRIWHRLHVGRREAAVLGGAAATVVTIAAIGIAVIHERQKHRGRAHVAAAVA